MFKSRSVTTHLVKGIAGFGFLYIALRYPLSSQHVSSETITDFRREHPVWSVSSATT